MPVLQNRVMDGFISQPQWIALHRYHYIQPPQLVLMLAKGFSNKPLEPVTRRCMPDSFAGNSQTEPWISMPVITGKNNKSFVRRTAVRLKNLLEFLWVFQPVLSGKTACSPGHGGYQAVRRLRPLALRALITSRPPLVRILARKPCWRCLLILLG